MISDIKPYPSAEIFNNKHRRRSVGLIGITSKTVFLIGTIRGSQTITALGITSKRACLTGIIRDTPIITARVTMSETEFLRNTHCI